MTRKEERERIARDYENKIIENNPGAESYDYMNAVIYGAKWADKTMIDKVCEYLKNLIYQEYSGGPSVRQIDDEQLEELRKIMKGE